jgi:hypothetical protein
MAPISETDKLASDAALEVQVEDASTGNTLGITASNEAKVSVTQPLPTGTNSIGQVTANAGTNLNTSALALDATVTETNVALEELTQSQGSTTSGQVGPLIQAAVTTAAPAYVTGQTSPISLTTAGGVRIDTSTIAGTTTSAGAGTTGAGVQRVVLPTDQTGINTFLDKSGSGTINTNGGSISITPNGCSSITIQSVGSFSGGLIVQGSSDGGVSFNPLAGIRSDGGILTALINGSVAGVFPVEGWKLIQIISTGFSGSTLVSWNCNSSPGLVQTIYSYSRVAAQMTLADKSPMDVALMALANSYYSAPIRIRQSAATASGATVWSMRLTAAATSNVYIERIYLQISFDAGTPLGRALLAYDLERFSAATPTAGTAVTVVQMDSSDDVTEVTDVRFLDTGLTTTGLSFGTPFVTVGIPASDGATSTYFRQNIGFKLAPGEGLAIRLNGAAVIGQDLCGEIVWSER